MVALLENKHDAIVDVCHKYGITSLCAFGSALRDDFLPGQSDVDLLVDFDAMDGRSRAHAYVDMLDELEALLGVDVDLVMTGPSAIRTSPGRSSGPSRCSMRRSVAAYLSDIVEACDAIEEAWKASASMTTGIAARPLGGGTRVHHHQLAGRS